MTKFKLGELDLFYISYDELNREVNWDRILRMQPNAKHVHGVKGFDAAHRCCAIASTTRRFVTVDGDNWVNDGTLDQELDDAGLEDVCFSFKSRNFINGLEYGNGGIKVWDRRTLLDSRTHEKADTTDFCWDIRYYQVNHAASTTVQNCTPYQAWRAGYREGMKMSQIDGKPSLDLRSEIKNIFRSNLSRLHVWCTVGRDVDNGIWSILGARQAVAEQMRQFISHSHINDYDWFASRWDDLTGKDPEILASHIATELHEDYQFYLPELDQQQSEWFKLVYMNPPRSGLMR